MIKFKGVTACEMNNLSRQGLASKEDLENWAKYANKTLIEIHWFVKTYLGNNGVLTNSLEYRLKR